MLEITSFAADLMKIFAQRKYNTHRYDDTTAIELLKYLQTLAQAEKVPTPKLDQYLAGEYTQVHIGCHIANIMCNQCGMEDVEVPDMTTMPLEEYQDNCKNIFPEVILKIFPKPTAKLDPYINLLPIWELELYKKVSDEVRILKLLTAIKCWIALLLYRVYCVGQAVSWKFKWKVKMFRNSL